MHVVNHVFISLRTVESLIESYCSLSVLNFVFESFVLTKRANVLALVPLVEVAARHLDSCNVHAAQHVCVGWAVRHVLSLLVLDVALASRTCKHQITLVGSMSLEHVYL
jgi:hypothetical protein